MARSNATHSSFLGGEWSQSAQARYDLPAYGTAMSTCRNGYPTEEGAWTRRPAFLELGAAYMGSPNTVNVEFNLATGATVYLEETLYSGNVYLRFWTDLGYDAATYGTAPLALLPDAVLSVSSISTASPAVVTVGSVESWITGDIVQIYPDQSAATSNAPTLAGRQLIITVLTDETFSIADMVTGDAIDGSTLNYSGGTTWCAHIATIKTSYTSVNDLTGSAALTGVRILQTGQAAYFLSASYAPQALSLGPGASMIPMSFTFADAGFYGAVTNVWDGPYNDPLPGGSQTLNSLGSVSNVSGDSWDFTITDGSYSFVAGDVGRQVRIWIQPALFDAATSYSVGGTCTFEGAFYTNTLSGLTAGTVPNQTVLVSGVATYPWLLSVNLGGWSAGVITSKTSSSEVVCTLNLGAFNCTNTVVDTWQLGAYYPGSWPSCGTFHEGRIWFGGLSPGRGDGSYANALQLGVPPFQPTDYFGEVTDANAISVTLNTPPQSDLIWMMTDTLGIVCGTAVDEWLVSAPNTAGAISPSNIQARRITRYGSAAIDPIRAGTSIIFVQQQQRQLIEYTVAPFASTTPVGWRLHVYAKHLTADGQTPRGIIGVTYQEEPTPILWVTRADSSLIGCTYRRQSTFGNEPPTFFGWHRHDYGYAPEDPGIGRNVASVSAGPSGTSSNGPVVSTFDPNTGVGYLEMIGPQFSENTPIAAGGSLDGSPSGYLSGLDTTPFGEVYYYTDTFAVDKSAGTYTPGSGDVVFTSLGAGVSVSSGSLVLPPGGYNVGCGGFVTQHTGSGGTMSATVTGSTGSTTGTLTFGTSQTEPFGTGFDCVLTVTTTFYITLVFSVDVVIGGGGINLTATPVG